MSAAEREVQPPLARAALYRLIGGGFAYPEPARLDAAARAARVLVTEGPPALADRLATFAAVVEAADAAALAGEHVFLFDRGSRCPPYEGAWGDAPQLAGKAALLADVAGFYAAFGLEPGAQPDVEDHIGAECEFMSALALKEAYALAEGDREGVLITRDGQVRFLGDHLGRWAGTFAEALREATPMPYYTALADLLAALVAEDSARLGAEPTAVAGRTGYDPIQEDEAFTCPMVDPPTAEPSGP
jgi:putative dimethyl sulfoxide reductase chaperone